MEPSETNSQKRLADTQLINESVLNKTRKIEPGIEEGDLDHLVAKFSMVDQKIKEYNKLYSKYPTIIEQQRQGYQNIEKICQKELQLTQKEFENLKPSIATLVDNILQSEEFLNNKSYIYLKHLKKLSQSLNQI